MVRPKSARAASVVLRLAGRLVVGAAGRFAARRFAVYRGRLVGRFVVDGFGFVVDVGVAFNHATHARQGAVLVHVDEGDALGGAAHFADLGDPRANQHARGGDQHDFVGGLDQHRPHHLAVAGGGLNGDHALGASAMAGVFDDGRALAIAVFGGGKH